MATSATRPRRSNSFNQTVIANGAHDMAGALKDWGNQVTQAAQDAGYNVTQ